MQFVRAEYDDGMKGVWHKVAEDLGYTIDTFCMRRLVVGERHVSSLRVTTTGGVWPLKAGRCEFCVQRPLSNG